MYDCSKGLAERKIYAEKTTGATPTNERTVEEGEGEGGKTCE